MRLRKIENKFVPIPTKIIKKIDEGAETFTLILDTNLNPMPGQFIMISIPGMGESAISSASYSKNILRLTIRQVGSFTNYLSRLETGDKVYLRGPYGRGFPMEESFGKNIVLIGGGCGVAPFSGVNEYILENRKKYKEVYLFFGFRSGDHVLYLDELETWKNNFKTEISIDKMEGQFCQNYKQAFITQILDRSTVDPKDTIAFICGPPIMMEKSIEVLLKKKFMKNQIYVSEERLMHCGFGNCCHCMIEDKFTCKDGPVFRYDEIEEALKRGKERKT